MFPGSEVFTALMLSVLFFWGVEFCRGCFNIQVLKWYAVERLVYALRYKPEGRRFDCIWFSLI